MSNPKVRNHLHFYPEDTGVHLRETRQADRWLREVRSQDTTPMIRIHRDDYYIFEPAMLHDCSVCMPHRWFTRDGQFFAKAWQLEQGMDEGGIAGWIVHQEHDIEVHAGQFLKNFPQLRDDFRTYHVSDPANIIGISHSLYSFTSLMILRQAYIQKAQRRAVPQFCLGN
jgi:hypothetical protein